MKGSGPCHCRAEILEDSGEHAMFLFHVLVTTDTTVQMGILWLGQHTRHVLDILDLY